MDDIIKNKKSSTVKGSRKKVKVKSEEESSSGEDMLAVLTKERDKKSIPNNFQERNNDKEVKEPVSKIKKQNFIRVVDNAPKKKKSYGDEFNNFNRSKKRKTGKYILLLVGVLVAVFFVLNLFTHAKVYIDSKVENFSFNNEKFEANKNSKSLPFDVMIVEANTDENMTFSNKSELSTKAKGTVTLYNEYSTSEQKLLINTRLSDDEGLIYMTDKAVTIPGYKKSGNDIIPGSVSVNVTAQNSGDKYNSKAKDFKIIGFKGTSKYEKLYARAKTDFTGGAEGTFYSPSEKEKANIKLSLENKIKDVLNTKIQAELPDGYITYPDSMQISIDFDSMLSETENAKISVQGTAIAVIFEKEMLLKEIIRRAYRDPTSADFDEISIPEIQNFKFDFVPSDYTLKKDSSSVSFTLSGDGTLIWSPIVEKLKDKLAGVNKNNIDSIFAEDPGILHARVVVRPPWKSSMPEDVEKIKIIEEDDK